MSTGDVFIAIGAALSAVGAFLGFVFPGDPIKSRNDIKSEMVRAWKAKGKTGKEPTSAQALTEVTKRRVRSRHTLIAFILVLAILANVAALVFG